MLYQGKNNEEDESKCAWILEYLGFKVELTPLTAAYDMKLWRDDLPYAVVEFKRRAVRYNTYKIDKSKIDIVIEEASKHHGVKPVLIVYWDDVGGYWRWICHNQSPLSTLRRTKLRGIAGETADPETVVYEIPIGEFKQI